MLVKVFIQVLIKICFINVQYDFQIIEILKLFHINTNIKIATTYRNTSKRIFKKYAEKETFINDKILNYTTNKINQYDYVKFVRFRNNTHKIQNIIFTITHLFMQFILYIF